MRLEGVTLVGPHVLTRKLRTTFVESAHLDMMTEKSWAYVPL